MLTLDERREQLGAYVQSCRISAGLTVDDVAARISRNSGTARMHGLVLAMIEEGRHLPTASYIDRIANVFPINRALFRSLAASDALPPTQGSTRVH